MENNCAKLQDDGTCKLCDKACRYDEEHRNICPDFTAPYNADDAGDDKFEKSRGL